MILSLGESGLRVGTPLELVQTECVCTNIVHALVDVVATKLGIIVFSFLSFFLPLTFLPEGVLNFCMPF